MEKVHLVIHSGACDYENWSRAFVFKNYYDAKDKFNELVEEDTKHAEEVGWAIEHEGNYFSSYEEGYYCENHTDVVLEEADLL